MKKNCPHCKKISDSEIECTECGLQFKDLKKKGEIERIPRVQCDEANCTAESVCKVGVRNVCLEHYVTAERPVFDPEKGFRGRWYAQRKLPYEPPNSPQSDSLRQWTALHGKPPQSVRAREPGEDDEPIALDTIEKKA